MDETQRLRHLQVADAARATLGINVEAFSVTSNAIGVELALSEGKSSWGTIRDPETLLDAARKLVKQVRGD